MGGGEDERLKNAFTRTGTKAGIALGLKGTSNALDNWLAFVFFYCREYNGKLLEHAFRKSSIDHTGIEYLSPAYVYRGVRYPSSATVIIERICQASEFACSHLVQQALEQQALERLAAQTPRATRKPNPPERPSKRYVEIYYFVIKNLPQRDELAYCRAMDDRGFGKSRKSKWKRWPGKYADFYKQDEIAKGLIRKEKSRVKNRVERYLDLTKRTLEELVRELKILPPNSA
jgi:hypothetical protein